MLISSRSYPTLSASVAIGASLNCRTDSLSSSIYPLPSFFARIPLLAYLRLTRTSTESHAWRTPFIHHRAPDSARSPILEPCFAFAGTSQWLRLLDPLMIALSASFRISSSDYSPLLSTFLCEEGTTISLQNLTPIHLAPLIY